MASEIRQTVTIDGRTLHLRRSGSGPAVVLLHESPRSSAVLVPLAARLARDFTVFALDSPGFGQSDPLPITRPTIQDFADAIVASLRALGVTRAPVYGTHTGAGIAIAIAKRHPDFATGAVLDGYPIFTTQEADEFAYLYLKLFEPDWEGQHVARLWSRVRDQYTFFPWYALGRGSRIERDPPSPEMQTAVVRDFLAAGSNYARGYEAAFRMDGVRELQDVSVPVTLMCRSDDLLYGHLDRLPPLPPTMDIVRLGPDRAVLADRVAAIFARVPGAVPAEPRFTSDGLPGGVLRPLAPGLLAHCYGSGAAERDPLVLLPDLPGGLHDWDPLARRLAAKRKVIVIHWPGGGVSPPLEGAAGSDPAAVVQAVAAALAAHGVTRFDIGGRGVGALAALDLAAQQDFPSAGSSSWTRRRWIRAKPRQTRCRSPNGTAAISPPSGPRPGTACCTGPGMSAGMRRHDSSDPASMSRPCMRRSVPGSWPTAPTWRSPQGCWRRPRTCRSVISRAARPSCARATPTWPRSPPSWRAQAQRSRSHITTTCTTLRRAL